MKRIWLSLAAIAAVAASLLAVIVWATPQAMLRQAVVGPIEALTGRTPIIDGAVRLTLFPAPGIEVERLTLPGAPGGPPLVEAAIAEGTLSPTALLAGRLVVSDITLRQSRLTLTGGQRERSWSFRDGALRDVAAGRRDATLPITSIRLIESDIVYLEQFKPAAQVTIKVPDATLDWPAADADLSATGRIAWRGHTLDMSIRLSDAATLMTGGQSDIRGKLTSDLLRIACKGRLSSDGRLEGDLNAAAPSLRAVARWIGLPLAEEGAAGNFKLQSPAVVSIKGAALSAAEIELDGNAAEGALTLSLDGPRPKISGTLAAETLNISTYAAAFELTDGASRQWRTEAIDLAPLNLADVDLRLSSGETVIDKARLGHMAASVVARNGLLELALGEASAYGGTVKGRLTMVAEEAVPKITAHLAFEDVEMARALGDFLAFRRLEGTGKGAFDLAAVGHSVAELLASLHGQASIAVRSGSLVGVDLADIMRRIERRPLSPLSEPRSGRTPFELGTVSFAIDGGVAHTTDARLDGGALSVLLGGNAGVAGRDLDMAGQANYASKAASPPFTLPFKITGAWDSPSVSPDADSLIRRSGAAAPFFLQGGINALAAPVEAGNAATTMPVRAFAAPEPAP